MSQEFEKTGGMKRKIKFSREADHEAPKTSRKEDIFKSVVVTAFILVALVIIFKRVNIPKTKRASTNERKLTPAERERIRKFNRYSSVGYFHEGYARAEKNGKYGFVDKDGNEIIPPKYEWVGQFKEGVVRVFTNDKAGYVEKEGKTVIPEKYDDAWEFSQGLAKVMVLKEIDDKKIERFGYVNKQGIEVVPAIYQDAQSFYEGLAAVRQDKKWGYINAKGHVLIPFQYKEAQSFYEGFALVKGEEGKPFFISKSGQKYDDFRPYVDGAAAVMRKGKWGFIDNSGKLIIDFKYDEVRDFKKGYVQVRIGKKRFYINKEGKRLKG
ncbi:hypothetical protein BKI52_17520 [marine bacterium AO1-C]|nr:hypothetical protein BKI52_17520 [marine bacterium AO1-C]